MKKSCAALIIGLALLLSPFMVNAMEEYVGSIQGLTCVTQGKVCPIGKEDAVIAAENVFVLLVDPAKGEWYFLPDLDRGVLARHLNEEIKVVGSMHGWKSKSIKASEIYKMTDGKWRKVWSEDWQNEIYKDLQGGYPLRGRPIQPSGQ